MPEKLNEQATQTTIDVVETNLFGALVNLSERLQAGITDHGDSKLRKLKQPKTKVAPKTVFQFKITLIGSKPPIWRRIQVAEWSGDFDSEKFDPKIATRAMKKGLPDWRV